ncbi:hypothetical protein BST95_04260 [Halioglobus japonicus]|nr:MULTISPECIES: DUF4136 domain-containing protein [Halioglobus]AQA17562.1 hypothetical protein BST95_04260 [Halioglobus japonicus]KZX56157.1 hypothetical protein A3709_07160 [Halioglobus sp. HI00S01]GHD15976.1 hypothetical protein GCM10007052_20840 [Halioglobus japonicus]
MRRISALASLAIALFLSACSEIETRPVDSGDFASGNYVYYKWRSEPLANEAGSDDMLYVMDPLVRAAVDRNLADKGYRLSADSAQFTVDYLQAMGLREGVSSQDASGGIDPIPSARPNRLINQAMVDNANALAGVHTTNNIAIQLNDAQSHEEVWRVVITKIVDDMNTRDPDKVAKNVNKAVDQGLRTLPKAN